jgi:hypothetical protein
MSLVRANQCYGKGWVLKIETSLGPEMATSKGSAIWAPKVMIFRAPFNDLINGFAPIKLIKSKCHIKTGTLVILCT